MVNIIFIFYGRHLWWVFLSSSSSLLLLSLSWVFHLLIALFLCSESSCTPPASFFLSIVLSGACLTLVYGLIDAPTTNASRAAAVRARRGGSTSSTSSSTTARPWWSNIAATILAPMRYMGMNAILWVVLSIFFGCYPSNYIFILRMTLMTYLNFIVGLSLLLFFLLFF